MNAIKLVAYGAIGALSLSSLTVSAMLAPFLLVGVMLGARLHGLIRQEVFTLVVYAVLAATGVRLVLDAAGVS